jgi:hypothetical protein
MVRKPPSIAARYPAIPTAWSRTRIDQEKFFELVTWLDQRANSCPARATMDKAAGFATASNAPWAEPIARVSAEERDFAWRTLHG